MRSLLVSLLVLGAAVAVPLANEKGIYSVYVQTTLGPVEGTSQYTTSPGLRRIYNFFAIPYGADTSGANRFRLPQPATPWTSNLEVFKTDRAKTESCLQLDLSNTTLTQGKEDCLKLSVYTPIMPKSTNPNPNLPVMVFIYGGAFVQGDSQIYNHVKLGNKDVVLVVPNYRLGILGFLTTHTDDAPGNAGLYDQLLALKWVRDNIAKFGGNPNDVTLFGESAGAVSVGHHIISPLSAGLFHRAILQSGSPVSPWAVEESPLDTHAALGQGVGCPWDPKNPTAFTNCLRGVNGYSLIIQQFTLQKRERVAGRHGFRGVSPVIQLIGGDNRLIKEDPATALATGRFNRVPTILGANKHEGSYPLGLFYNDFLVPMNLVNSSDFLKYDAMNLFVQCLEILDRSGVVESSLDYKYLRQVSRDSFNDIMPGLMDFIGAVLLKSGSWTMALFQALHDVPVWFYSFEYKGQYTVFDYLFADPKPPVPGGVAHGDELLYMFMFPYFYNSADKKFSSDLITLWTNFAIHGHPTPSGYSGPYPTWPQCSRSSPQYMVMDSTPRVASSYPSTYTIAVDDLMQGKPIPGTTTAVRTGSTKGLRDRMRIWGQKLQRGDSLIWTEEDEAMLH